MKLFRLNILMPFGFFLASAGYLAFAATMETAGMIGDTRGYDPGGRFVPILAGAAMGVLSLWLLVREIRAGNPAIPFAAPLRLTLGVAVASLAYIAAFRHLGYVPATCCYLFLLIVLNLRATGTPISWPGACGWLLAVLVYAAGAYSLTRFIMRSMFRLARSADLPLAREPAAQALVAAAALCVAFFVVGRVLRRLASPQAALAVQTCIGTTMSIYIAFRLLFLVQLPAGLFTW